MQIIISREPGPQLDQGLGCRSRAGFASLAVHQPLAQLLGGRGADRWLISRGPLGPGIAGAGERWAEGRHRRLMARQASRNLPR